MPDAEIYMAKDTFVDFSTTGGPMRVNLHATARAGHPIIAANPTMWIPLKVDYEIEQQEDPEAALRALRPEAAQLGINVDGRWSSTRLRKEIDQVKARQVEMGQ